MAPRLSKRDADAIDECLRDNPQCDMKEVAVLYGCTYNAVSRRRANIRRISLTGVDHRHKAGRPRIVTPEMLEYAVALIERDPTLYLDEVADFLYMEFGIQLEKSQVSRLWKNAGVSHKKLSVQACQRNEVLISAFTFKMTQWDARQLIFVDESAYNERTGDRRYGWGPSGHRARVKRWLKKSERWSLLPAYTLNGYLNPILFKGAITAQIFQDWLRNDILPNVVPPPGLRIVLIKDNCRIHKSPIVIDICNSFNVDIEFIPPYCPEFNPIEASFHDLKAYLRRWYKPDGGSYDNFENFLIEALRERCKGPVAARNARAHFKHSGYLVLDE